MDLLIKTLEVLLNEKDSRVSTKMGMYSVRKKTSNWTIVSIETMFRLWNGWYYEDDYLIGNSF